MLKSTFFSSFITTQSSNTNAAEKQTRALRGHNRVCRSGVKRSHWERWQNTLSVWCPLAVRTHGTDGQLTCSANSSTSPSTCWNLPGSRANKGPVQVGWDRFRFTHTCDGMHTEQKRGCDSFPPTPATNNANTKLLFPLLRSKKLNQTFLTTAAISPCCKSADTHEQINTESIGHRKLSRCLLCARNVSRSSAETTLLSVPKKPSDQAALPCPWFPSRLFLAVPVRWLEGQRPLACLTACPCCVITLLLIGSWGLIISRDPASSVSH